MHSQSKFIDTNGHIFLSSEATDQPPADLFTLPLRFLGGGGRPATTPTCSAPQLHKQRQSTQPFLSQPLLTYTRTMEVKISALNLGTSIEETTSTLPTGVNPPAVDTCDSSVLWRLVHHAQKEMLRHVLHKLPPEDRAMLSRVDRACCAIVGASGVSLVGGCKSKPFRVQAFTTTVQGSGGQRRTGARGM